MYLQQQGYRILAQNWRRPSCEIDIVAQTGKTVVFVEVKFRENNRFGSGLEYITYRKLAQMRRAALQWVQEEHWKGDYQLAAMSVGGPELGIEAFVLLD